MSTVDSVNHFSFTVSDLERAVRFYNKVLNLDVTDISSRPIEFSQKVTGIPNADLQIAYVKAPNVSIELIKYNGGEGVRLDTAPNNVGSSHVCFYVNNFNACVEQALHYGARLQGEVCVIPGGPNKGRQVAYLKDCEQNNIEFISAEKMETENEEN